MKQNKVKLLLIIFISLVGMLLLLYVLPFIHPVYVIYNPLNGYTYTVYSDHIELNKYNWDREYVKIPDYLWGRPVTVIGESCFSGYTFVIRTQDFSKKRNIQTIELPKYLEIIEASAFCHLYELKEVFGGEEVRYIGAHAFVDCWELQELEFGDNVEYIGRYAFSECKAFKEKLFLKNVQVIGAYAFWGTELAELPKISCADYIGTGAFNGTPWLESQTSEFVIYNDILLAYSGEAERVVIPEGVRGIAGAFQWNEAVREIYIPEGTEYIDAHSFYGEGVRIYIPASVTLLGKVTEESDGEFLGTYLDSDITIITTSGSVAEQYANENNIPYEIVEGW